MAAFRARHVEVAWRDGKLDKITEATTRGVGIDLYVDGRYASVSTSDLRPEALERFVADSVALARTLAPDPHRRLPEPALYQGQSAVDLDMEDLTYAALDAGARRQVAEAIEAAARSVEGAGAILSVTTSVSDSQGESALVHTNGFEGNRRATDFWIGAEVTVKDPDGRRPEEYASSGARHRADLETPEVVGRRAGERAVSRIGTRKGESAVITLAVDNRASGRLVGSLFGPLAASSLQQKRSFLEGKVGAAVGSAAARRPRRAARPARPRLAPLRRRGDRLAAVPGLRARRPAKPTTWTPTTAGSSGSRPPPRAPRTSPGRSVNGRSPSCSRPWARGSSSPGSWAGTRTGRPGTSRSACGASGCGAAGWPSPIGEMNVSGNHLELWKQLAAVGNDPYRYSAMRTPTLVFEGVQLAGT